MSGDASVWLTAQWPSREPRRHRYLPESSSHPAPVPPAPICLAHPASFNTNLAPLIEGPVISLAPKHAKVRREGYRP